MPLHSPWLVRTLVVQVLAAAAALAGAQPVAEDPVVQAREALRKKDGAQLAQLRQATQRSGHPLAQWVDYFEIGNRLGAAQQPELDAFFARWPGTYVEDRLRNDWLLELGRRRDWANFRVEFPRFRMNDDREVTCYALLTQHLDGQDVREAARAAWFAQRELDDGCNLLATTLREARRLSDADLWHEARLSVENNRLRPARAAVALVRPGLESAMAELLEDPQRYLSRRPQPSSVNAHELDLLALMRLAASDPEAAASQLDAKWGGELPAALAATAWAHVAKQSALKLQPAAIDHVRKAWQVWDSTAKPGTNPGWSDDLLAWHARAALRAPANHKQRWPLLQRAVDAMSPAEQKDAGLLARPRADGACRHRPRRRRRARSRAPGAAGHCAAAQLLRPAGHRRPGWPRCVACGTVTAERRGTRGPARRAGLHPRAAADPAGPAQRRRARMELHAARAGRPQPAGRRPTGV
jgi:soluble lytic murein transglycosylase